MARKSPSSIKLGTYSYSTDNPWYDLENPPPTLYTFHTSGQG